jgi:hypothetical protein
VTPAAPAAAVLVDDFSAPIGGARWRGGDHSASLVGGKAVLTQSVQGTEANFAYNNQLIVRPPANGQVTALTTDVVVTSATATGDSQARASIEIFFQPPANRLLAPNTNTNLIIARISFVATSGGGLLAVRQFNECLDALCSSSRQLGSETASNWPSVGGLVAAANTTYTVGISYDANRVFTFTIAGGGLNSSATIDAGVAPLPIGVDFSAANFYRARLNAAVRGGAADGGNAAVSAQFDDVQLGTGFAAAAPFDTFDTGTDFDASRWRFSEERAQVSGAALEVGLHQREVASRPPAMELRASSASALQADVTVTQHAFTGSGGIRAVLQATLYNDGVAGTASDPNVVDSQVGDLVATIGLSGADAVYAVIRCNTVACEDATFVKPYTSLGTAALGSTHTLYVNWDAATNQVAFKLDGNPVVGFDPVAAGYPVAGAAHRPLRRLGAIATGTSASEPFTTGSAGSITAAFDNVRTN